jgi:arylsulfatase A-like enzyme
MPKPLLDQRWPWLTAALAIVLAFFASLFIEIDLDPGRDPRPLGTPDDIVGLRDRPDLNVLFIVVDTLTAERLGSYGYERDTSPALDRLASTGARFSRQLAQSSWTKASMASLWTGLYPTRTGITRFDDVVPEQAQLPAEILRQAGFRTTGIYRNGWVAPTFGFEQGFDVYMRPTQLPTQRKVRIDNPTLRTTGTDEDSIAAALEFLRIHGDEPWFLYLHLMDLHEYVYDTESAIFGGTYSDIYDNSIRRLDGVIATLLEHVAAWGYATNTLVAITSDHGEAFRERGIEGHARRVYRETTEVPFLIAFPFQLEQGIVVETRTRNVDVWPTLFDLSGIVAPDGIDGRSLVPDMLASARGQRPAGAEAVAVAHLDRNWGQRGRPPNPVVAVAEGSLRYVRAQDGDRTVEELFDAQQDPAELDDRSERDPEALARLRTIADAYLDEEPTWGEAPTRELDELELHHLRALGYVIP